jgi:hypothetical protein
MKKIVQIIAYCVLILTIESCKKEETKTTNSNQKEFLEITIDGQKLRDDKDFGLTVGTILGQSQLCDGKSGVGQFHTTVKNSRFDVSVYIVHHRSSSDFSNSKPGDFQLTDDWVSSNTLGTKICNLALEVKIDDDSKPSSIISGQKHTVSSITKIKDVGDKTQYLVEGTFSGNYKNKSNVTYPVSGSYSVLIEVLK